MSVKIVFVYDFSSFRSHYEVRTSVYCHLHSIHMWNGNGRGREGTDLSSHLHSIPIVYEFSYYLFIEAAICGDRHATHLLLESPPPPHAQIYMYIYIYIYVYKVSCISHIYRCKHSRSFAVSTICSLIVSPASCWLRFHATHKTPFSYFAKSSLALIISSFPCFHFD